MTIEEMREGLSAGRVLTQEEWSTNAEIAAVDQLVTEGFAVATPWEYHPNFQCERRKVRRAGHKP